MSKSRLHKDYVNDILDAMDKADTFLGDLSYEEFAVNPSARHYRKCHALMHLL